MADKTERPQRFNKSRNETREIHFSQIVTSADDDLCHREPQQLTEAKIAGLSASLVQEGLATAMTVCESDSAVTVNGESLPAFQLVGGHRRFGALQDAIDNRSDPARIFSEMKITVVVMVRGDGQTDEEFRQDIVVRSVTENEQRLAHTAIERLLIVKQLEQVGVPVPRAAAALGISVSQYRRDRLVATWPWLFAAVEREEIGASDAAKLAELAKDKDCEELFRTGFERWVHQKTRLLEDERVEQKKLGKELKGAANTVKKFLDIGIVKNWLARLKQKRPFGDEAAEFNFGVVVDQSRKTVTISGVNQSIDKLKAANVASMIAEMQAGVRKLVPVMRRLQQLEQATEVSDEDIDAELARVQRQARRDAEARAAREAGREPVDASESDEDEPIDLADQLDGMFDGNSDDNQLSN